MEIRIVYTIDGYRMEEIIDTEMDYVTEEIWDNISSVYVLDTGETIEGINARAFIKEWVEVLSVVENE